MPDEEHAALCAFGTGVFNEGSDDGIGEGRRPIANERVGIGVRYLPSLRHRRRIGHGRRSD
jgi:hypothetical protein